jgi:hypothetical protein
MKLLLISATRLNSNGSLSKGRRRWLAGLTLPYLAALTPPDVEVEIVDEYFDDVSFDAPCDLVGITFMSHQAPRAYQLGDNFRAQGKAVVMGGFHASFCPEEALEHCDSVVVGEAEPVWEALIDDARSGPGRLKPIYRAADAAELRDLPSPRFDLLDLRRYKMPSVAQMLPVQTTRGCPYQCYFCEVTALYGGKYRFRPIADVIRDIQAAGTKLVWFVDDNITAHRQRALELFRAIKALGIQWTGLSNLWLGRDEEMLDLMIESGCVHLNIGLESIHQDSLRAMNKRSNLSLDAVECLGALRDRGLFYSANVIFGTDSDDTSVFAETAQWLIDQQVPLLFAFVQTPRVGTQLRSDLLSQGRILHDDWTQYAGDHCVFEPRHMSPGELEAGLWQTYRRFYSARSMAQRLGWLRPPFITQALASNLYFYASVRRGIHPVVNY